MRLWIWGVTVILGFAYAYDENVLGVAVCVAAMLSIAVLKGDDE